MSCPKCGNGYVDDFANDPFGEDQKKYKYDNFCPKCGYEWNNPQPRFKPTLKDEYEDDELEPVLAAEKDIVEKSPIGKWWEFWKW